MIGWTLAFANLFFQVFVFLILFLYCLITSPFLLVAMAASGGACWYAGHRNQDRKLILGGKEVPLAQQYAAIGVISIPLFVIAGAGTFSKIREGVLPSIIS